MIAKDNSREWIGWALLTLALAYCGANAWVTGRGEWPDLLPREATVLMQASSLAEDFDLRYTRLDFDRILLGWRGNPPDLYLASASEGREITFDLPAAYALWLAPWIKVSPERGFVLANLLMLALAFATAGHALRPKLGALTPYVLLVLALPLAPTLVRVDGDVFLAALALWGASCLLALPNPHRRQAWLLAGAGAAYVTLCLFDPIALCLLPWLILGLGVGLPADKRRASLLPLALGGLAAGLTLILIHWSAGGGLYVGATSRFKFTPDTGYPLVDFAAGEWARELPLLRAVHWDGAPRWSWGLEPRLVLWNGVYGLLGQHGGLVFYATPLLWALFLEKKGRRLAIGGLLLALVALMVAHAFNLLGLPGPLGNRHLIPFLGAALLLAPALAERFEGRRFLYLLVGTAGLNALFWAPTWSAPAAWPFSAASYRHLSPVANFLPFEASQRWLYRAPFQEHQGLWIAPLDGHLWVEAQRDRLMLDAAHTQFLILSLARIEDLELTFAAELQGSPEVSGGQLGDRILAGDGRMTLQLVPDSPKRHGLWLGPAAMAIYRFEIQLPEKPAAPLAISLTATRADHGLRGP